jgi:predicted SPOUT superfamily RNA methylase MTH1
MIPKIQIAVPSSLTVESADQKIKTYKVGQVARAAAVFRINRVLIYRDNTFDDSTFISSVLRYMETPQYLRKLLFPLTRELRYIGVVPPLKTPHHVKVEDIVREGIVTDVGTEGAWVEIGLDCPALMRNAHVRTGQRVTVKVFSRDPLEVELFRKTTTSWGYSVEVVSNIKEALDGLVISTTKYGQPITPAMLKEIVKRCAGRITVVFGSPNRGLDEILSEIGLSTQAVSDYVVNAIPNQGTETVRVEEAIIATLSVLNIGLH